MDFNIYSKIEEELEDFNTSNLSLAQGRGGDLRYLEENGAYTFSQKDTLEKIDLYYNSKFETGEYDSEGQRKLFLNIVSFRTDVAVKMIDVGVKDFTFIPMNGSSEWKTWLLQEDFRQYAQKEDFGKLINELEKDYAKYGSCVSKKVGNSIERVPIRSLRNTQSARTLYDAVVSGGYVIEEHEYSQYELEQYPWDTEDIDLEYGEKLKCYERYGLVPESLVKEGGRDDKQVISMAIVTINKRKNKKDKATGNILFIEKITDIPYREAHWDKEDGRWLGIGNVERQFENQVARNTLINLRRRSLFWSSKHVFQSPDTAIAKNLVLGANDGDVLEITQGGQITQVDTQARNIPEISSDEQVWENNSNQLSFTYDIATGENQPSGTPFRLGVILSNAVTSHFQIKKENFAFFLRDTFFDLMIPIFKKQSKEHILTISNSVNGVERLKEAITTHYTNRKILDTILNKGELITPEEARTQVESEISKRKYLAIEILNDFYSDVESNVQLEITGEGMNTASKIETLKTVMQVVGQNPAILSNPVTKGILSKIVSLTGESLESVIGVQRPEQSISPVQTPNSPQQLQQLLGQAQSNQPQINAQA